MSPSAARRPRAECRPRRVLPLSIIALLAGCGDPGPYSGARYQVKGQVLLADGKPLNGGFVQFIPSQGGLPASGAIGPDGTFSLKSVDTREEGAAPGEYKVRVEPSPELLARKAGAGKNLPFAAKYRDYDGETGLTATINAEPTQLEPFRLDAR